MGGGLGERGARRGGFGGTCCAGAEGPTGAGEGFGGLVAGFGADAAHFSLGDLILCLWLCLIVVVGGRRLGGRVGL